MGSKIMNDDLEAILKKYSKDGLVDLEEVDELLKLINRATRESYSSGRTHGNYDIKTMLEKTLMVEMGKYDPGNVEQNKGYTIAVQEHNSKITELLKGLE